MDIYQAIVTSTYGQKSKHPRKAAWLRLACLEAAALGFGWVLDKTIAGIPFVPTRNSYLTFTMILTVQIILILALTSSQSLGARGADTLSRMLTTLPLSQTQRWLASLLPGLILATLVLSLTAWPICSILQRLGLPNMLLLVGVCVGTTSAFGLLYGLPVQWRGMKHVVILIVLGFEYKTVALLNNPAASQRLVLVILLCLLYLCLGILLFRSRLYMLTRTAQSQAAAYWLGNLKPCVFWFLKKLIRSPSTRTGLGVTLVLSTGLAWALHEQHGASAEIPVLAGCLLAAAYASDIRALCRRLYPAEIINLQGTWRFTRNYMLSAHCLAIFAVSPLIWVIAERSDVMQTGIGLTFIVAGTAIGMLAGALIVPRPQDITSQFSAALLCIALLVSLLKVSGGTFFRPETLFTGLIAALASTSLTVFIEYKRNNYLWRKNASNT